MARLKTEHIKNIEHNLDFKYNINVTADGKFNTTLPASIVEIFEGASMDMKGDRGRKGYFVSGSLKDLIGIVDSLVKEYVSTTIVSENLIIRYSIQTQCTYVITDDGDIGPNGHYSSIPGDEKWKSGTVRTYANDKTPYGLQVFAKPLVKRVLRYKSGKMKDEYSYVTMAGKGAFTGEFYKLDEHGKWLDDVVGIGPVGPVKEMPYSEKMAEFFVNMIKSICKLNERIKDYIEPDALMQLAENGQKLLG